MANTVIQLKYSTNTGTTPSGLSNGEIAINTYDGKIFYSDPSGSLQTIIKYTGPAGLNREIQFNNSGVLGSSSNLTYDIVTYKLTTNILRANVYFEFPDGSKQYTANAGTGSATYPASGIAVSNGTAWISSTFAGDPVQNLGYLNVPQNAQSTNYTLVIGDSAKDIYMAANQAATTYTIPSAANVAFPIGTVISFTNMSANALSIAISSFPADVLYLSSSGATGTRTLAQYGTATMKKVSGLSANGIWLISGTGLT